jgi:hypothetical protein
VLGSPTLLRFQGLDQPLAGGKPNYLDRQNGEFKLRNSFIKEHLQEGNRDIETSEGRRGANGSEKAPSTRATNQTVRSTRMNIPMAL